MSVYEPGHVLGEHELLERLGRGGMGEVWLARHVEGGGEVALKVLFARADRRREARERFEREVEAARRIGHPGVVRVEGCGTDEIAGAMFIVMERLIGRSLRAWMESGGVFEALELVRELLDALRAAHECVDGGGRPLPIIHRDLKPENVFVLEPPVEGRRVKLLDFGIARQVGDATVTDTGVGMGTAAYMSPEQATDAREVGPEADVWSIGVMLYEILAGRSPFAAPSKNEIISKILTSEPVPLLELAPSVPPALGKLVARCLAKEPHRRPRDARALASELDVILGDPAARHALASARRLEGAPEAELPTTLAGSTVPGSTLPGSTVPRSTVPASTVAAPTRAAQARAKGALVAITGVAIAAALGIAAWPDSPPRPRPTLLASAPEDAGVEVELNRWIEVEPASYVARPLGIDDDALEEAQSGFRPSSSVRPPLERYRIQQHEVTWGEVEPRLLDPPILGDRRPPWLPADPAARARFPATGIAWRVALRHCVGLGGTLPTEEQWEHAARGDARRGHPWGGDPADPDRTNLGPSAQPIEVMTRDQDRTPGDPERAIWDLAGNAREWTLDPWRSSTTGRVEPWAISEGRTFRAVRGLPLIEAAAWRPPDAAPVAHRTPLCATGECPEGTDDVRLEVGFRCVRNRD